MPYVNPIVDGMKVCRQEHRYDSELKCCPVCRKSLLARHEKRRYESGRALIEELKRGKICERCGYDDYRALQFHHKNPEEKKFSISDWVTWNKSIRVQQLDEEIAKCELICANCHQIEHYPK